MRTRYLCTIPVEALEAATTLQRDITERPEDPPVFRLEQARGEEIPLLYAHVWLWTEAQTQAFVAALPGIGGTATQTYPVNMEVMPIVENMGRRRRPDIYPKQTAELTQMALDLGITPTPANREALLEAIEDKLVNPDYPDLP